MKARNGFTLIELMVVITMIGLLMAMITGALWEARQAAKRTRAQIQLRDLIAAWSEYYLVDKTKTLPASMGDGGDNAWTKMNKSTLQKLIEVDEATGFSYLNLNDEHFDKDDYYADPWGTPYEVKVNKADGMTPKPLHIRAGVSFVNRKRE